MIRRLSIAALLLLVGATAYAQQPGFYGSVDVVVIERAEDEFPGESIPRLRPFALAASGGYRFTDYIAAELRVGRSAKKRDTFRIEGTTFEADFELEYWASAFAKPILPIQRNRVNAYALVGITTARQKASLPGFGFSESETRTGFSFGAGLEMWAAANWGAKLEWTRYQDKDDVILDGWHLGALFRF